MVRDEAGGGLGLLKLGTSCDGGWVAILDGGDGEGSLWGCEVGLEASSSGFFPLKKYLALPEDCGGAEASEVPEEAVFFSLDSSIPLCVSLSLSFLNLVSSIVAFFSVDMVTNRKYPKLKVTSLMTKWYSFQWNLWSAM